jgi:hypothetical protein
LVSTIKDQSTTSYTDTNIPLSGTKYYYKIYVLDKENLYNQGSNEVSGKTLWGVTDIDFPKTDDMEGIDNWGNDIPWVISDDDAHSGSYSWSDSPYGSYENNMDRSIYTIVNLDNANRPYLTFWHKYNFEEYCDFGFVEVSTDNGTSWKRVFYVTGFSGSRWYEVKIDLSSYTYQKVIVRFRTMTNESKTYDGWHIDDVSITDNEATISFPFFDDMESEGNETNWLMSTWEKISTDGNSGKSCLKTGNINLSELVLNGTIDFTNAINPQLSFWHHRGSDTPQLSIFISNNSGHDWTLLWHSWIDNTTWEKVQIDLSDYSGLPDVIIKFQQDYFNYGYNGLFIDDVLISDAPENVLLNTPENISEHSMHLSWSKNEDLDFVQYEIYRNSTPEVNRTHTLINTIKDQSITSYTDINIPLSGTKYYFKIYILDDENLYNQGSNEVSGRTFWGVTNIAFPKSDDMEGIDNWGNDIPWDISDDDAHGGRHSWSDSPYGSYENNMDRSIYTIVNLQNSNRPFLNFWHKYNFEEYCDFGFVEVSTDNGATWKRLFYVTGFSGSRWYEVKIDLSSYYSFQEVIIRFRTVTNESKTYDGWHIDDVSITDNETTTSYPFFDDMNSEESESNWLMSTWKKISTGGNSGRSCFKTGNINFSELVLNGKIDLTNAINPQLSFWHHRGTDTPQISIFISNNSGHDWTQLWNNWVYNTTWEKIQIDLSDYTGLPDVVIKFQQNYFNYGNDGWFIDDVRISEPVPPEGTITGRVIGHRMCFQYWLKGAIIVLEGNTTYEITTVDNGLFTLNDIPNGTYNITITHPDFENYYDTLDFSGSSIDIGVINMFTPGSGVAGDANFDGLLDLKDIINGLQVLSGIQHFDE